MSRGFLFNWMIWFGLLTFAILQAETSQQKPGASARQTSMTALDSLTQQVEKRITARDSGRLAKFHFELAKKTMELAQLSIAQNNRKIDTFMLVVGIICSLTTILLGIAAFFGYRDYKDIKSKREEIDNLHQQLTEASRDFHDKMNKTSEAFALHRIANKDFEAGKLAAAIINLERAQKLLPDNLEMNLRLGQLYNDAKEFDKAIKVLDRAVAASPHSAEARKELGFSYRRRAEKLNNNADYDAAIEYLTEAVRLEPGYSDALATLGGLYRRLEKHDMAIAYYSQALNYEPDSSYALGNIASLTWHAGDTAKAQEYFRRVEEVADKRIQQGRANVYWDYYDRALARLVLQNGKAATADLETAIDRTPAKGYFDSVLSNLIFLNSAKQPISGLDKFIQKIETAAAGQS